MLLQPIWLLALGTLVIPIIIHLRNRQPEKLMKVGSIQLMQESTVAYKSAIRPVDLLLLLLRCLLLTCLAFALAQPVNKEYAPNKAKGWVLMDRQHITATYNRFKPAVDSLLKNGYSFHYLETGFPDGTIQDTLLSAKDSDSAGPRQYRALADELNHRLPPGFPVVVFADNYRFHYNGERVKTALALTWNGYTPVIPYKSNAAVKPLALTLLADPALPDTRYLLAALQAIQAFTKQTIHITSVRTVDAIPAKQDWLICLDETQPANLYATYNLFYAKGKTSPNPSVIIPANGHSSFDPVALYQRVLMDQQINGEEMICWRDGFGHPVLTMINEDGKQRYTLATRINPAWTDLPWNKTFPAILFQLLYAPPAVKSVATDSTLVADEQLGPIIDKAMPAALTAPRYETRSLQNVFWLLAALFFLAERVISLYYKKPMV